MSACQALFEQKKSQLTRVIGPSKEGHKIEFPTQPTRCDGVVEFTAQRRKLLQDTSISLKPVSRALLPFPIVFIYCSPLHRSEKSCGKSKPITTFNGSTSLGD